MKIGIITLSASFNCGSMLQSYALKRILEKYGEVEIINFSSEASHRMYDIVPRSLVEKIYILRARRKLLKELKIEAEAYNKFQREMLGISGKEYFAEDLAEVSSKYDVIVAGSDQIWNVCMGDFDEAFFCGWTNSKKVAYAPSLGGHDIKESLNEKQIIEWIKRFDFLSVREEFGKKCLENILKRDVVKVLDPTLVFGNEKWKTMVDAPFIKGDYIFYYSWAYCDEELRKIISQRSEKTSMPVYVIDAHKWRICNYADDGFILCSKAGPMAFLNLMYYAKECYVESFHGMLFAYMFKKNFWLLDSHEKYEQIDSRLREVIELVGARERILTKYNKDYINMGKSIDYHDNLRLAELCQVSQNYIEGALLSK